MLEKDPIGLNSVKFWKIRELKGLLAFTKEYLLRQITSNEVGEDLNHWYAISAILLHIDKRLLFRAYEALCKGAKSDSDFKKKNVDAVIEKLKHFFGDRYPEIVSIIQTKDPVDFPWLINKL